MVRHQFAKISDGLLFSIDSLIIIVFICLSSQLLSYGRRLPLHELNARIDVRFRKHDFSLENSNIRSFF